MPTPPDIRARLRSVALLALVPACTHWNSNTVYGQRREVRRQLIGAPQIAESTTASMSAGLVGGSVSDGSGTSILGGLSASGGTLKRTHCVQQAQLDFVQPYQIVSTPSSRTLDWIGSITIGVIGLSVVGNARSSQALDPYAPGPQQRPNPTGEYLLGGAMIAGAIGWMAYSYARLPHQPAPPTQSLDRRWSETQFVEVTGCGLPGTTAPAAPAAPAGDAAARLLQLDRLHQSGVITDEEYVQKRKALLEQL
ncbi:MAG: SHOCT domain-containing protein [Deltaproteobacteria bacterium]|nr:SHOCT domain-containing protein [Deltaproteobacteria bacterium]